MCVRARFLGFDCVTVIHTEGLLAVFQIACLISDGYIPYRTKVNEA